MLNLFCKVSVSNAGWIFLYKLSFKFHDFKGLYFICRHWFSQRECDHARKLYYQMLSLSSHTHFPLVTCSNTALLLPLYFLLLLYAHCLSVVNDLILASSHVYAHFRNDYHFYSLVDWEHSIFFAIISVSYCLHLLLLCCHLCLT